MISLFFPAPFWQEMIQKSVIVSSLLVAYGLIVVEFLRLYRLYHLYIVLKVPVHVSFL